jgi:arsenate reductase
MAAAFFNNYVKPANALAISAGTRPAEYVHPEVIEAMREVGIELGAARPRKLAPELTADASILVTMGCGDDCPYVPGLRRKDWPLPDPKGVSIVEVKNSRRCSWSCAETD